MLILGCGQKGTRYCSVSINSEVSHISTTFLPTITSLGFRKLLANGTARVWCRLLQEGVWIKCREALRACFCSQFVAWFSLTGIGEIVLLPLDVLKIKRQTNPEAFRSRGFLRIVADEGFSLYRGWGWTAARNAPGSFALFGGSAFTKEYLFGLEDFGKATWGQNFVSSIGGAVASITVAAPLDVVKTRIQNANFESTTGGVTIIKDMIKNEGFTSFFKGLTPKILVVGPKLIFSFTLAQSLIPLFGKYV